MPDLDIIFVTINGSQYEDMVLKWKRVFQDGYYRHDADGPGRWERNRSDRFARYRRRMEIKWQYFVDLCNRDTPAMNDIRHHTLHHDPGLIQMLALDKTQPHSKPIRLMVVENEEEIVNFPASNA
jgi:hypothetical protein